MSEPKRMQSKLGKVNGDKKIQAERIIKITKRSNNLSQRSTAKELKYEPKKDRK